MKDGFETHEVFQCLCESLVRQIATAQSNHKCFFYFYVIKKGYFFYQLPNVFWPVDSKSDVQFHRQEPETLDKPEKLNHPDYREFQVFADENGYWV